MTETPKIRRGRRSRGIDGRKPLHGTRALERVLNANGLDQRTVTARLLRMIEGDLIADAGGEANLTNRERLLIRRCAAQALILESIEAFVFGQPSLLTETHELLPVLRKGYIGHVNALRHNLVALGLKPDRAETLPTLGEYIAARSEQAAGNGPQTPDDSPGDTNDSGDGERTP